MIAIAPDVLLLSVNVLLAAACLALLAAVAVGAFRDRRERRRWHSMVPDGWPPAGADLAAPPSVRAEPKERRVGRQIES